MGCLCYAKCLPVGDKFEARAVPSVHMGYSEVTKGYVLFNLKKHAFFISRDVSFREDVFLFHSFTTAAPPSFVDIFTDFS